MIGVDYAKSQSYFCVAWIGSKPSILYHLAKQPSWWLGIILLPKQWKLRFTMFPYLVK
tara:strand:+ start:3168 stop:3341 length:174 start_codon:yes stop_codon:yes gene_type:complete